LPTTTASQRALEEWRIWDSKLIIIAIRILL